MKTNLKMKLNKTKLKVNKNAPTILVISGVVAGVASAVMACKATRKLDGILNKAKEEVAQVNEYVEANGYSEDYTEKDAKNDITVSYAHAAVDIAKLYAPAVILGTASVASILYGHKIINKRNIALAAAYAATNKDFKVYRDRVIERFGDKLDKELKLNIKPKDFETIETKEDGTEEIKKETVEVIDPTHISEFARFFDDGCIGWTKDPEHNLKHLQLQQKYANDVLQSRGYLFLNEVYDMLGIPRTKAGQIVGWVYDKNNEGNGDGFVDFGIFDINKERNRAFVNGYERTILLDFNVDGNILDLI